MDFRENPQAKALLSDKEKLEKLLKSEEAKTLAALFQKMDGEGLKRAAQRAMEGDGGELEKIVSQVKSDEKGAKAIEKLGKVNLK